MRLVIALGGNAILKRGEPQTAENQRHNVKRAAEAIGQVIAAGHEVIVTHGNGPQVGLMALQDMAYDQSVASPLDMLGAETEGMIGYLIEQELGNAISPQMEVATLLTQVEVDAADPAFQTPSKQIGPIYDSHEASEMAAKHGWAMVPDGSHFRRAVPSPQPKRILEIGIIRLLIEHGVTVICTGGGGIPVVRKNDGSYIGIEAVIDKDHASGLLARQIGADALLMLTDVDGVYLGRGPAQQRRLGAVKPAELLTYSFPAGSMGPKVQAAIDFVSGGGRMAGIGKLEDALAILEKRAGTLIIQPT
ncbi:MAG: carbamate kinase [Aestuariivirga sp.]